MTKPVYKNNTVLRCNPLNLAIKNEGETKYDRGTTNGKIFQVQETIYVLVFLFIELKNQQHISSSLR